MAQFEKMSFEELNSSHDFDELNEEIKKLVSLMSHSKDSKSVDDLNPLKDHSIDESEQGDFRGLFDSQLLNMSPIWKNTPQPCASPSFSSIKLKGVNDESYHSNSTDSSLPSPVYFKPNCNQQVGSYFSSFYSIQRMKDKYEDVFNSSQESPYVPRLDNERNVIHLLDIFTGKEQRTTLMIRHIPNKYTLKLITDEINQKFFNKYDVFYLPIDYANNCNLGFAFINFVNPMHIIDFYEIFRGKKWGRYLSEKRCELAFAKIQGKLNLIAHFEKGNVLHQQTTDKKPLILFTPNPLPNISLSFKYEDALREYYPYVAYGIDVKSKCLSIVNFSPCLM